MNEEAQARNLLGNTARGASEKRLLGSLDMHATDLAGAVKRSVPFLMRQRVEVTTTPAHVAQAKALLESLDGPTYVLNLVTDPGGSRALLAFDARAIAFMLEGALGGTPSEEDSPEEELKIGDELTNPQSALMARIAEGVLREIVEVLAPLGFRLKPIASGPASSHAAELVCVELGIGTGKPRRALLAVGRQALEAAGVNANAPPRDPSIEARVPRILEQVELELSIELGRARRTVAEIQALRVGHVLKLDTSVAAPVVVRVDGVEVLRGKPTVVGGELALTLLEGPPT
ncbi:MAG: FliM/FliN family flagellar motor switch protein [Polyangiaceae bacterium]